MAYGKTKQTDPKGVACSPFEDAIVPKPEQKGQWGGMGQPLGADSIPETKGEISGVQFLNTKDGAAGGKGYGPGTSDKTTIK